MADLVAMKEMAMKLIADADYDMASVYFEQAGDESLKCDDREEALVCYREALNCFQILERKDLIDEISKKMKMLNK